MSVYNEDDLTHIHTITGVSGGASIGLDIGVISKTYYHQIFYSNKPSSDSSDGNIGLLEIFVNRRDSSDYTALNTLDYIDDDSYNYFGKYFEIDSETNRLYISSYRLDTNPSIHQIEILQICSLTQTYNSGSDSCSSLGSSSAFTTDIQSASSTSCSSVDDTQEDLRIMANSLCNYGCADYEFGKN